MVFVRHKNTFLNISDVRKIEIQPLSDELFENIVAYSVEILTNNNKWYEIARFESLEKAEDMVKRLMESLSADVIIID